MTRVGIYFGLVQFLFVSCWTVYVIYLPQLLAQAGIEKKWVIWVLMADQIVFTLMDFSLGVAADKVVGLRACSRSLRGSAWAASYRSAPGQVVRAVRVAACRVRRGHGVRACP